MKYFLAFTAIILLASYFRFVGNNWDSGQHLHPDERFLTIVATAMEWPKNISEYFDTSRSKLNPHNIGHSFYVYGTWPVIFVKAVAERLNQGGYGELTLVGRKLSAVLDIFTLILIFFITYRLIKRSPLFSLPAGALLAKAGHLLPLKYNASLFSMFSYAVMTLPIQLSHFYTSDPYVTTTLTATLLLLTFSPTILTGIVTGFLFGLSVSAKLSALPFAIIIILATGIHFIKSKNIVQLFLFVLSFLFIFYCTFRTFMPYMFADSSFFSISLNDKVINNINQLKGFNDPNAWFPPAVQWVHTTPLVFPFLHMVFIGVGFPVAILSIAGLFWSLSHTKKNPILLLPVSFFVVFFLYNGIQFTKAMRYFYPVYPVLAITAGMFLAHSSSEILSKFHHYKKSHRAAITLLFSLSSLLLFIAWPVAFVSIYQKPHSRVTASEWIYETIPAGASLANEHWDDGLPLNINGKNNSMYTGVEIPIFGQDGLEKWQVIGEKLETSDYIILSSNRAFGSLPADYNRFPDSKRYYQALFSEELGFDLVASFVSRPTISIPGVSFCIDLPIFTYGRIDQFAFTPSATQQFSNCSGLSFVDDYTDESWTVYDHPKVYIFKKTAAYSSQKLLSTLGY